MFIFSHQRQDELGQCQDHRPERGRGLLHHLPRDADQGRAGQFRVMGMPTRHTCTHTCLTTMLCEHTDIVHRYLPPHATGIVYVCVHILRVFVRKGVRVGVLCIHVCHVCVHSQTCMCTCMIVCVHGCFM